VNQASRRLGWSDRPPEQTILACVSAAPSDPADASPTFAELGLDPRVLQALADVGYESPSPVQAATIPPLMAGRHVVGLAQTGTGKTAAFALPILSRIDLSARLPQALVLAPTRELALQVSEAIGKYAHHLPGARVLPIYGGQAYSVQLAALKRGIGIVVGTPGRVIDHLNRGTLDLSDLHFLVLDEADEMLQMGFAEDVETILSATPDSKQVALFSATMPPQIRRMAKKYLNDAVEITVRTKTVTAARTHQRYLQVDHRDKLEALTRILEVETFDSMIIFVRTKQATEDLAERLRARGFSAAAINGDLVQAQRERTIAQLKSGSLDILVATDVAARGLDVERISHVVNYDIPHDTEAYVHRIGRTGRAGRAGDALLFVTARERHLLSSIERATRQPLTEMSLPSVADINSQRVARLKDSITASLQSAELPFFRELVGEYVSETGAELIDVAAVAVLKATEDDTSFLMEADPIRSRPATRDRRAKERPAHPGAPVHSAGSSHAGGLSHAGAPPRVAGQRRPRTDVEMATYRIRVGRQQRVQPAAIVGAIANEGGLTRTDFGHIDIRADHSLVELPANLSPQTVAALRSTRISGQLIDLTPEPRTGSGSLGSARPRRPAGSISSGGDRKKPRYTG
jgi:ATP-dependent RNA helicase DeaD